MTAHKEYLLTSHFKDMGEVRMIFDIGCDRMVWSTPFLRAGFPDAVMHCFEPDPDNVAHIEKHGLAALFNVEFRPYAMGIEFGPSQFWETCGEDGGEWPWSGSTKRPLSMERHKGAAFHFKGEPVWVQCDSVDHFCMWQKIPSIDLLCMDVQGAEGDIIIGAKEMLPHIRYIYAEHSSGGVYTGEPGLAGLQALLPGWETVQVWPYDVLFKNPFPL